MLGKENDTFSPPKAATEGRKRDKKDKFYWTFPRFPNQKETEEWWEITGDLETFFTSTPEFNQT